MEGIKDTSTLTFRKIMGNGLTYEVPRFQRDYSWESENWDDLWQDIDYLYNDREKSHYMGYLVLQTSDEKKHIIIDGQQRITTISLLIIAVLKRLKNLEEDDEKNKIRRDQLANSYIGYLDPVTLVPENKLILNKNNDDFYRTYIVPMVDIPFRGTKVSEKLMRNCFNWIFEKINKKYKDGETLVKFVDKIVDKLFFTVITVGDDLNAYKVFETLNARGVKLSSSDLLKNYLFSSVDNDKNRHHPNEIKQLEILWDKLLIKLGNEKVPEFIRYYWNSKNKTVRKTALFKIIKTSINSKKDVFELLRDLDNAVDIYKALLNPYDEMWKGNKGISQNLKKLKLFGAKQPISLLMSAHSNLNIDEFSKVLNICSVIYFRYNIIGGKNPNEQEVVFNKIANEINKNKSFTKNDFKTIYPNDNEFGVEFENKQFPNNKTKIIRYILSEIENRESGTVIDYSNEQNSIEHILPENPSIEWAIEDEKIERFRYRLGNLTLLEKNLNKDCENYVFNKKKSYYERSNFKITKGILEFFPDKWSEDEIVKREAWMIKQAKTIWKINFD